MFPNYGMEIEKQTVTKAIQQLAMTLLDVYDLRSVPSYPTLYIDSFPLNSSFYAVYNPFVIQNPNSRRELPIRRISTFVPVTSGNVRIEFRVAHDNTLNYIFIDRLVEFVYLETSSTAGIPLTYEQYMGMGQ